MSDTSQTPEADAIPTPAPTPTAPAATDPRDLVAALLAFAAQHVNNPGARLGLNYVAQYAQQYEGQLAAVLGTSGPLTVRGVVDKVFAFVEGKARRPIVRIGLVALNEVIDTVGLPLLQAYLLSVGIPIPLS
jgi:hypothetical protein